MFEKNGNVTSINFKFNINAILALKINIFFKKKNYHQLLLLKNYIKTLCMMFKPIKT